MAEEYSRSLLRVSVAQICQNLGWHSAQSSSLEVLTDVLERYIRKIAVTTHRYTEHYGRTEPNLDDLGLSFQQLGINISELEDYVKQVDPVPFAHEVVAFPSSKPSDLSFPNPRSREILQHREEHVDDHLPYMYPNMKDEIPEERTVVNSEMPAAPEIGVAGSGENDAEEESVGEKRNASSIVNSSQEGPPSKRQRIGNPNLPEEAGHSQYEMTCVFLNQNGVLTTRQGYQGKKPEPRMPPPNPHIRLENKENSVKTKDSANGSKITINMKGLGEDPSFSGKSSSKKDKSKSKKSSHRSHDHELTGKELGKKSSSSKAAAKMLKKLKSSKHKSSKLFNKLKHGHSPEKSKRYVTDSEDETDRKEHKKHKKDKKTMIDTDEELLNLDSPSTSREVSPERGITNDSEGGAHKKAQMEAINDGVNSVLRDTPKVGRPKKKKDESSSHKGESSSSTKIDGEGKRKDKDKKEKKKPGRKPKEKIRAASPPPVEIKPFVSDKYSSTELEVYEFADSPPDASVKARRPSAAEQSPAHVSAPPPPSSDKPEKAVKSEHHSSHSNKSSSKKHKYLKPVEDDLFAPEIKLESQEKDKSKLKPKIKDERKEKTGDGKDKSKSKEERIEKSKDKKEKSRDNRDKTSQQKYQDGSHKYSDTKEDKEKYKDKEHRKDKKDKKRDKEKKKKHKEKDKEKGRRDDKMKDSRESRESSPAVGGVGVKLKIKIGGNMSTSMMLPGDRSPASPALSTQSGRESMSPPRSIPKLFITTKSKTEEKPKKQSKDSKRKLSPLSSTKSRSNTPSSSPKPRDSTPPRHNPTPPISRKTPTPPPPSRSSDKTKERRGRSPVKKGKKEKKKKRDESLSSLSSSSSLSPSRSPPGHHHRQTPPRLSRKQSPSSEKSPAPTRSPSPRPFSRASRSPSGSVSPTPPPSRRKLTPPPSLSPAPKHSKRRSMSPSPTKPPTPGSTSPPASPDHDDIPLSPLHHQSPNPSPRPPRPRTPTLSPAHDLSPMHSSPDVSPERQPSRSPSPPSVSVSSSSRPGSRSTREIPSPSSSVKSSNSAKTRTVATVEAETVCVFYDENGEKVWICPGCKQQDDGSEMIGCDQCDNWYHWPCAGITEAPPEDVDWFCPKCELQRKNAYSGRGRPRGRGRGRGGRGRKK